MHMTLNHIGNLATVVALVVALLILVYVTATPTVNRWATVKYLRAHDQERRAPVTTTVP